MSFNISIGKNSPLSRVLPSIIPSRLGKLRTSPIDSLDCREVTYAIVIWSKTHNWPIFLMKLNVFVLETTVADVVKVPERRESSPEWTWNISQRRKSRSAKTNKYLEYNK